MSEGELKQLLTQSAEVGYRFDLDRFGVEGVPFEENTVLQQIVAASVNQATADFKNLTQTLGMVDPYGKALPLQDVYRNCIDFAYEQVATGAVDYNTAIREATRNIARYGNMTVNLREMALKKELSIYSTDDLVNYEEVVAESFAEWYNSNTPRRFCGEFLKEVGIIDG